MHGSFASTGSLKPREDRERSSVDAGLNAEILVSMPVQLQARTRRCTWAQMHSCRLQLGDARGHNCTVVGFNVEMRVVTDAQL